METYTKPNTTEMQFRGVQCYVDPQLGKKFFHYK